MQDEIIVITYLSTFSYSKEKEKENYLKVHTYKDVEHEDKKVYAILTNEAGIQDIYDSITDTEKLEDRLHIVYFATKGVQDEQTKDIEIEEVNDENAILPRELYERLKQEKLSAECYFKEVAKYHFYERFHRELSEENFCVIPAQNKSNEQLSQDLLKMISNITKEKKINIQRDKVKLYVDTTGGFRDISYLYVLLSQILSYSGYEKPVMVYSSFFGDKPISHIDNTFNLLNVTNAFHEFISYGKVRALRDSLSDGCSPLINALLDKMEAYSDDLALCRWENFKEQMQAIKSNIAEIERSDDTNCANDRIFKLLISKVSDKMGLQENANFGDLFIANLTNCVENEMYQQAITLYREKLCEFLKMEAEFQVSFLAEIRNQEKNKQNKKNENRMDELEFYLRGLDLMEYTMQMKGKSRENNKTYSPWAQEKYQIIEGKIDSSRKITYLCIFQSLDNKAENLGSFTSKEYMIANLESCIHDKIVIMDQNKLKEVGVILRDYAIIHELRNKICHSGAGLLKFNKKIQEKFSLIQNAKEKLKKDGKKITDTAIIKQAMLTAIDHLIALKK